MANPTIELLEKLIGMLKHGTPIGAEPHQGVVRDAVVAVLNLLQPASSLGPDLRQSIWRQVPEVVVMVSLFKTLAGHDCIYLSRRWSGEPDAGLLCIPGTSIRGGEHFQTVINRLGSRECGSTGVFLVSPHRLVQAEVTVEEQATTVYLLYLGFPSEDTPLPSGGWFPLNKVKKLRNDLVIPGHRDRLIPAAYAELRALRASGVIR